MAEIPNLNVYARITGCLHGGALGDSIGAFFENQVSPQFDLPPELRSTDDTQLTIATCEAIVQSSCVDPESIAARMTDWFRDRRISGIGASTLKSLTELAAGGHWAFVGATGERSAGNGAAMRIAPLAFLLDPTDRNDRTIIRDVCRITHRNDEAYLGALSILHVIKHRRLERDVIDYLIVQLPDSRVRDRFIEVKKDDLYAVDLALRYPPTGYVVDSVPLSILCAIESISVMESIKSIVEFGGDTDTIASMFGHLIGAIRGMTILPMEFVERIDMFELISRTAKDLCRVTIS